MERTRFEFVHFLFQQRKRKIGGRNNEKMHELYVDLKGKNCTSTKSTLIFILLLTYQENRVNFFHVLPLEINTFFQLIGTV